ncbi:MAG: hypothetical protein NTW85_00115 [Methylococcales bacterium]|nr:hypothetical protein [Methylococcales bacterium]
MTKAIKFNLLLDKHPVRDLDDLRANFNLDDLLTAYHSHTLHRWLEVRGLTAELEQLNAIKSIDELSIASALCELFQETLSETDIKTAVYPLEFRRQQQQQLEQLASQQFNKEAVIKSYHAGYKQLCAEMLEKAEDYPFLKAAVNTLWTDYAKLFRVDFNRFFEEFIEKSPLTLFTMLANDDYRQSGIFKSKRKESVFSQIPVSNTENVTEGNTIKYLSKTTQMNWNKITDKKVIVKKINNSSAQVKIKDNKGGTYSSSTAVGKILDGLNFYSMNCTGTGVPNGFCDSIEYAIITTEKSIIPLLPPYQSYTGVTDGYWKDLQPKGTYCLILSIEAGNFIRNSGKNGEELNAEAINKQFLILDGIDYKSNNADHTLIYMVI